MRFDQAIDLLADEVVEDGLGGRIQGRKLLASLNAHIDPLSIEETYKIYGEATTCTMKVRVLGNILEDIKEIRYNGDIYKVISKRIVKNKTTFLMELVDDEY